MVKKGFDEVVNTTPETIPSLGNVNGDGSYSLSGTVKYWHKDKSLNNLNLEARASHSKINLSSNRKVNFRDISDYISGMTDRYAINLYKKIK